MAGYAPKWNHHMPMTFPRFFSNLDLEKLRKIRRHYIIERTLNICKITKFESDTSWASEHIAKKSWKNSEGLLLLVFNKSLSNLAILLI